MEFPEGTEYKQGPAKEPDWIFGERADSTTYNAGASPMCDLSLPFAVRESMERIGPAKRDTSETGSFPYHPHDVIRPRR